ncbi:hypothetical protein IAQ61_005125 [Plenodomus lingam]|uniref:Uncharacterized protein n=1 Tax=Leptosphaeria maculans (strain JN3 / isolate v23.1.3 / race Av1-4-5-6-7-8) TaxID=985895 RepID=E5A7M6_LEPMJ|nr:hypothetical protein LEMA_P088600.1 [Plenodomus lingam JN3]KAH9872290.1 hypothetical protein IAQ61_005125 [Plenodomus lingam]CBX99621.1 hypothetical protein LEMA_P088600.1 [Plenodomus lingam JN3]
MRLSYFSWALLSISASAQAEGNGWGVIGVNKAGSGSDEAVRVFEDAGYSPNASDVVTFTQNFNNTAEEWTWRINVSEIAVPDNSQDLGLERANFSEGLHVAHTQWQLVWPGEEDDLLSFVKSRSVDSARFSAFMATVYSNITDRFEDSDDGDCTPMLGERCVESIRNRAVNGEDEMAWSNLEGCESTFDARDQSTSRGISFSMNADDEGLVEWPRNGTLVFATSAAYGPGETAAYNQAIHALHILVMNYKYGQGPVVGASNATVVCRVVEKAAGADNPEQGPGEDSAAVIWQQSLWTITGLTTLVTLFVMW